MGYIATCVYLKLDSIGALLNSEGRFFKQSKKLKLIIQINLSF